MNADSTPLTDLGGFNVYYGTETPLTKENSSKMNAGNVLSFLLKDLPAGFHYFRITAYDDSGNESVLSDEEVSKDIV